MRIRDKTGLKGRRGQIDNLLEHDMEKSHKLFGINYCNIIYIGWVLGAEIKAQHAADIIRAEGHSSCLGTLLQTLGELSGTLLKGREKVRRTDGLQRGNASRNGNRVAR